MKCLNNNATKYFIFLIFFSILFLLTIILFPHKKETTLPDYLLQIEELSEWLIKKIREKLLQIIQQDILHGILKNHAAAGHITMAS